MFKETNRKKCEELFDKYYAGKRFSRGQYEDLIRQHVFAGARLLDAGCGRYLEITRELPRDVQAVGIDLEDVLETDNAGFPYGVRGNLEALPFQSDYFDLVVSRSVIEHLQDPGKVFGEFYRVLKAGGKVILVTPNKYDYVSVIASVTPYRWHRRLVSRVVGVGEDDVYPTLYRANSMKSLNRELSSIGFRKVVLKAINHYPVYLMFSPVLFRLGVVYERLTSAFSSLENLRGTLLCVFEKPGISATMETVGASNATSLSARG
jgi:ubiquinone/menaquinone biosynthesis C-methylase UbiE